jgi:hypothetical protein
VAFCIQPGYSKKMNKQIVSTVVLVVGLWFGISVSCEIAEPLFKIERSKNKNIVQYDICVSSKGDISDASPVRAYWVLANGQKQDLNIVQRKFAYGIESQESLGGNRFKIVLVAFKSREMIVEKIADHYRALVDIDGKRSILEKVYVKAQERAVGFPKVEYLDLFGQTLETNVAVTERIIAE